MKPNCDGMCEHVVAACGIKAGIPWLLMASLAYYCGDGTIALISDGCYDHLCKRLLAAWDEIEHEHKPFITKEDLAAGSLHGLNVENYPTVVRAALFAVAGREGVSAEVQERFDRTPFVPPAWAMDTYLYGADDKGNRLTWKAYHDWRRSQVRENIARIRAETPAKAPETPQGGQQVVARVRQRPTAPVPPAPVPVALTVRSRERVRPS
jgi:hypothetical protein